MFKKKKKALFGGGIEPDCRYCRHNGAQAEGRALCTLGLEMKNRKCKKYRYDPLMREPRSAPPICPEQFSEDDFKL